MGNTDIHRHRGDSAHRQHLPHHDLADDWAIPVSDDQLVLELGQRQKSLRGPHRHDLLLLARSGNIFGMHRIAANRDHEPAWQLFERSHYCRLNCR